MKPVPYTQTYPKPALCISTMCKISEPYDPSMDSEASYILNLIEIIVKKI